MLVFVRNDMGWRALGQRRSDSPHPILKAADLAARQRAASIPAGASRVAAKTVLPAGVLPEIFNVGSNTHVK